MEIYNVLYPKHQKEKDVSTEKELPEKDEFFLLEETEEKKKVLETNTFKKVSLGLSALVVGGFLLTSVGLALHTFKSQVPWIKDELSSVKFPIKGENLIISKVESHWEYSEKAGSNDELPELIYTPRTEISIDKKSSSGKMRCFFVDGNGKYIGDPVTKSFKDGAFTDGKTITFSSTTGFEKESDFNAYFSGFESAWHVEILEGAEDSNSLSQFKKLASIPLYYNIKEAPKKESL